MGTGGSAWSLVPSGRGEGTGGCPEEPRRNQVSSHRNSTPQRGELLPGLCSPPAEPHCLPHRRDTNRAIPVTARASSAFSLPIALERAAAADISIRAKSPCKQLWSEPLGACNISRGPSRVFSVLFAGWRASTLCARVLDAAGHHAPPSSQAAVRLVLIPPAAAELPGRAAHARPTSWGPDVRQRLTQTSPAMCTQPRPGKNPPPR